MKLGPIAVALASACALVACSAEPPKESSTAPQQEASQTAPARSVVSAKWVTVFQTVEDFVELPDHVAVVTVSAEEAKEGRKSEEATVSERELTLDVEEALSGPLPGQIKILDFGSVETPSGRMDQIAEDGIRLEVGDRAVVAISRFGQHFRLVNNQSSYLLDDGEVQDTGRKDAVIKDIERLSEQELKERVRQGRAQ